MKSRRMNPPGSPFSTRLSGSARETELRIRSIFQWKKKRPPTVLMALVLAVILLCGNLIACQAETAPPAPDTSDAVDEESIRKAFAAFMADETASLDSREPLVYDIPASVTRGGKTLAALSITEDFYPRYTLGIGVVESSGQLTAPPFIAGASGGAPHVAAFQKDGADYLLYTCNGMHQGLTWGEAGLIRFDGSGFTWVWPVEGDVRDESSQAYEDYHAYWEEHLALLAPGGLDVFSENSFYAPASPTLTGGQWYIDHYESFYPVSEDVCPLDLYSQVRVWLEGFSRYQHNPWDCDNASACWRILSLTPNGMVYPDQTGGQLCYTLLAQADNRDELYLGLHLVLSGDGAVSSVHQYVQGDYEAVTGRLTEYDASGQWTPEAVASLPLPAGQPLELEFCSGAGAWQTVLTLSQDGSFTGEYRDDDMGARTAYVCSFRGRFGRFQRLTDGVYSMSLEELELTTGRPVGEEWTEDGTLFLSSEPYGLEGGVQFRFYTPEVPAMALPEGFLLWYNGTFSQDPLRSRVGPLGCWGIYNLESKYGFFSYS